MGERQPFIEILMEGHSNDQSLGVDTFIVDPVQAASFRYAEKGSLNFQVIWTVWQGRKVNCYSVIAGGRIIMTDEEANVRVGGIPRVLCEARFVDPSLSIAYRYDGPKVEFNFYDALNKVRLSSKFFDCRDMVVLDVGKQLNNLKDYCYKQKYRLAGPDPDCGLRVRRRRMRVGCMPMHRPPWRGSRTIWSCWP
jgi:hypothetical protein